MYIKYRGDLHMKPRVFISSTFYDLKYIREDLANFIRAHDFEPIMFEDGDIGYTPGKPLDESCYETMRSADMVILVIGGNYGSKATGEDDFKDYISVTRKEFKTAVEHNVPIFAFVDSNILVEYSNYEINVDILKENITAIKFKNTKDIKVFEFISEIYSLKHISIVDFKQIQDIKDFLSKQWSDMFKNYLAELKSKKQIEEIENSIKKLNDLMTSMNIMIDGISKKVFDAEEKITYESLIEKQEKIKINSFCSELIKLNNEVSVSENINEKDRIIENFISCLTYIYKEHNQKVEDYLDMTTEEQDKYYEKLWDKLDNKSREFGLYFDHFEMSNDPDVVAENLDILVKYPEEIVKILSKNSNYQILFKISDEE